MEKEYYTRLLESKSMIIKLSGAEVVIYPGLEGQHPGIGFRANVRVKAGKMEGAMEINAAFALPEEALGKITLQNESLNQAIDGMEFIKSIGNQLYTCQSINSVLIKMDEKKRND